MEYRDKSFADSREVVDGNRYENCTFKSCGIVYCGGEIPHLVGCKFDKCAWHFDEAAQRTLQLLHMLYHGTGEGGQAMIEETIKAIRSPTSTSGAEAPRA